MYFEEWMCDEKCKKNVNRIFFLILYVEVNKYSILYFLRATITIMFFKADS